jgi:hypothetical protein
VANVLNIVLEGQRGSASVGKIVNTLLYYRAVTHHMIPTEGGLLRRLAERSDWVRPTLPFNIRDHAPHLSVL